ncbi:hypothetical protein PPTG_23457 [Phytophthora nicotianae INRA-310]|uniref:Uncharacterized protein n=1 Tax=Phytophthora nicotianae (strain INRA-310) TaxID=761204 RepID=W2PYC6_PHYN3|nr:hypothetical protein PPTG_23457 [Phytophthora nicotianae INRA-310]ETN05882.1 hypothetical protein PPTG_23457 [Phytophthora nicotianae INRA-310]
MPSATVSSCVQFLGTNAAMGSAVSPVEFMDNRKREESNGPAKMSAAISSIQVASCENELAELLPGDAENERGTRSWPLIGILFFMLVPRRRLPVFLILSTARLDSKTHGNCVSFEQTKQDSVDRVFLMTAGCNKSSSISTKSFEWCATD